jgi:predicted RecB family nuclease
MYKNSRSFPSSTIMTKPLFSKTGYIKGRQCLKALYLSKKHPSLRDPLPPERKTRFDIGHEIGKRARALFPGGTFASSKKVNAYKESLEITQQLLQQGCPTLYEAAFLHERIIVYCDILIKDDQKWKIAEVKSSNYISETYKEDLALQHFVISGSGIPVSSAVLITLKSKAAETDFSRAPSDIFTETNLTDYCKEEKNHIQEELQKMKWMLTSSTPPTIEMGEHCDQPYPCDFKSFCRSKNEYPAGGLFLNLSGND